jgi:hypothetical protein
MLGSMKRVSAIGAAVAASALALPAVASAHGLVGKQDLPIPRWIFAWAAAAVLIVSFVALATMWATPRLQELRENVAWRIPAPVFFEVLGGIVGIAVFVFIVYAGLAGTQSPLENVTPTFVFYVFWVGVPFVSAVFGNVFALFNPWRALARGVAGLASGVTKGGTPEPLEYPRWLGRWPAAIGILGFAWVELVLPVQDRTDPSTLSILLLAYAAVQLIGMSLYGIEPWLRNADPFGVAFGLVARLAPLHWVDGELRTRKPLAGAVSLDPRPGTVPLICIMIGTTAFDGFSAGALWNDIAPDIQRWFIDIGLHAESALELTFTLGLLALVLLVSAFYRLGVMGMRTVDETRSVRELSGLFAHTLVPIALAYVVAHYFSALTYQAQAMAYLISDPLGNGSNIFGTASATINYNWIGPNAIWYVQVGALIVGHVGGLILAHDRALATYRDPGDATRSQYWMLVVMVGFTSLGLWLLSAASQ